MDRVTAMRIRNHMPGYPGQAQLFKLSQPMSYGQGNVHLRPHTEYVIVAMEVDPNIGPITHIFAASAEGRVLSRLDMRGSYRGLVDHAEALSRAGWNLEVPHGTHGFV